MDLAIFAVRELGPNYPYFSQGIKYSKTEKDRKLKLSSSEKDTNKHKKIPGAIFATAGIVSPSIIIITLIALFISNFEDIIWVQKALRGINVGVSALLTYSVLTFAKKTIKKWWNMIFYLAAFIAVFFFKIPSFLVVIASILGGLAIGFFSGNLKKINKDEEHRNITNNATQTEEKN